jgi:hypothetical protein
MVGMQASTTTVENSMEGPQKTKTRSPIWSSNTIPRVIPKQMWDKLQQRHLHTHVYCSTIYYSQAMETTKMYHYWQMD